MLKLIWKTMISHKHSKNVYCDHCGNFIIVHKGRRKEFSNVCGDCLAPTYTNGYIPVASVTATPQLETSEANCVDSLLSIIDLEFKDNFEYKAPDESLMLKELHECLGNIMKFLTASQRQVIELLYLKEQSIINVSEILNITQIEVIRLEKKAFSKLRYVKNSKPLREFIS